jgi:hypothetical protein
VGILTDRDIAIECTAAGHNANECRAGEHMTGNPVTIEADAPAEEALAVMGRAQVRRLPVTEDGRCVGIVALGDVAVPMPDRPEVAQAVAAISPAVPVVLGSPRPAAGGQLPGGARLSRWILVAGPAVLAIPALVPWAWRRLQERPKTRGRPWRKRWR